MNPYSDSKVINLPYSHSIPFNLSLLFSLQLLSFSFSIILILIILTQHSHFYIKVVFFTQPLLLSLDLTFLFNLFHCLPRLVLSFSHIFWGSVRTKTTDIMPPKSIIITQLLLSQTAFPISLNISRVDQYLNNPHSVSLTLTEFLSFKLYHTHKHPQFHSISLIITQIPSKSLNSIILTQTVSISPIQSCSNFIIITQTPSLSLKFPQFTETPLISLIITQTP